MDSALPVFAQGWVPASTLLPSPVPQIPHEGGQEARQGSPRKGGEGFHLPYFQELKGEEGFHLPYFQEFKYQILGRHSIVPPLKAFGITWCQAQQDVEEERCAPVSGEPRHKWDSGSTGDPSTGVLWKVRASKSHSLYCKPPFSLTVPEVSIGLNAGK